MKKIRRMTLVIVLTLLLTTIPVFAAEEQQTPKFSEWAVLDIIESEREGIFAFNDIGEDLDLTKELTKEQLDVLIKKTSDKLGSYEIKENKEFTPVEVKEELTREIVLLSLYNILGKYDTAVTKDTDAIKYLSEHNIVKGDGKDLKLEEKATYEQATVFFSRGIEYIVQKEGVGAKGIFYKVENEGNTVYLFGTIHVGTHEMYPMDKAVKQAYMDSDEVYGELDLTDPGVGEYMAKFMYHTDGKTLKDDLGEETYNKLKVAMDKVGIPEETYQTMLPWAVQTTLSNIIMLRDNPASASLGIDTYFLGNANILGKPIGELESIEFQTKFLSEFDEEYYKKSIIALIPELEKEKSEASEGINVMVKAWIEGDRKGLTEIIEVGSEDPFSIALLKDRDPKMADVIAELLEGKDKKTYFVTAGAAHYAPEGSVIKYLKDKGYTVENLNKN